MHTGQAKKLNKRCVIGTDTTAALRTIQCRWASKRRARAARTPWQYEGTRTHTDCMHNYTFGILACMHTTGCIASPAVCTHMCRSFQARYGVAQYKARLPTFTCTVLPIHSKEHTRTNACMEGSVAMMVLVKASFNRESPRLNRYLVFLLS
jgi:hypothetical protein